MGTYKTADESRNNLIASMGKDLGELFYALSTELTWLHWRWAQYRVLFGNNASRIDLLNESAPFFFRLVQDVFFEDTLLGIARLVGSSSTFGKSNLTIARLPDLISDKTIAVKLADLVKKAMDAAEFAVDWRNRHLAHRDLSLALDHKATPLKSASRKAVENAMMALREVLNHIEFRICRTTTAYDQSPIDGDTEQILNIVRDGLLRRREKEAFWEKGELHPDDLSPPGDI